MILFHDVKLIILLLIIILLLSKIQNTLLNISLLNDFYFHFPDLMF